MGHYASEMDPEWGRTSPEEVERLEQRLRMKARGYHPSMAQAERYEVRLGQKYSLWLHKPCGGAVFDPDAHDLCCPAIPKST